MVTKSPFRVSVSHSTYEPMQEESFSHISYRGPAKVTKFTFLLSCSASINENDGIQATKYELVGF